MAEKQDILDQIVTDLDNYFNTQNGYRHTPFHIKRGNYWYSDFSEKPVLCLTMEKDEPYDGMEHGVQTRLLTVMFYVYDKITIEGETGRLLEMVEDLEDFLDSSTHFTYRDSVLTIGEINVFEGGKSIETGVASISVEIIYNK
jgi:hypothetical protein